MQVARRSEESLLKLLPHPHLNMRHGTVPTILRWPCLSYCLALTWTVSGLPPRSGRMPPRRYPPCGGPG